MSGSKAPAYLYGVLLFSNPLVPVAAGRTVVLCICGGQLGCTGECEELLDLAEGGGA